MPVWNGLTDEWHPTQMLADILTMRDHTDGALEEVAYCYLGDARNNTANSLLVTGALLGMDVRVAAPEALWPSADVQSIAHRLAAGSGARVTVTEDAGPAVRGADFLYTDIWLSMGEPAEKWDARIDQLLPYQVNGPLMAGDRQPGGEVPALPSCAAQHRDRSRPPNFRQAGPRCPGGDRRGLRVHRVHRL